MDDLAAAECYYEPEEISKHINADAETSIEKDLPLYLDPNHPKFSSEVAIVFHYIRELYEEKIKFDAGGSKIEQLIFIIQKDYPNLSQKAMDRIATVILPDSQRRLPQKGRTAKKYTK